MAKTAKPKCSVNAELLAACSRMLADLLEQRDTGLCRRSRDQEIADLHVVIAKAKAA